MTESEEPSPPRRRPTRKTNGGEDGPAIPPRPAVEPNQTGEDVRRGPVFPRPSMGASWDGIANPRADAKADYETRRDAALGTFNGEYRTRDEVFARYRGEFWEFVDRINPRILILFVAALVFDAVVIYLHQQLWLLYWGDTDLGFALSGACAVTSIVSMAFFMHMLAGIIVRKYEAILMNFIVVGLALLLFVSFFWYEASAFMQVEMASTTDGWGNVTPGASRSEAADKVSIMLALNVFAGITTAISSLYVLGRR